MMMARKRSSIEPGECRPLAESDWDGALDLLGRLYPHIDSATLASRLDAVRQTTWANLGVFDGQRLVAFTGYWQGIRVYCGTYLYVDHFVVDPALRGSGIGKLLLDEIKSIARRGGAELVCLDTFVGNTDAQRFWLREGFRHVGQHFVYANARSE